MPAYKHYFTEAIRNTYPANADDIIAAVNRHYQHISVDTRFAATSGNPIDRRLDFSAYFLALIKTLDEQGESFDNIRKICLEIVTEYVRPKNKLQQYLKRLPVKLINTWLATYFIKRFAEKISQNTNKEGFIATVITDKAETLGLGYGFDILECGICKLFNKHRYQQYASILCEVDELTSSLAGLKLVRSSTIALGAAKCDFRFKKITTN